MVDQYPRYSDLVETVGYCSLIYIYLCFAIQKDRMNNIQISTSPSSYGDSTIYNIKFLRLADIMQSDINIFSRQLYLILANTTRKSILLIDIPETNCSEAWSTYKRLDVTQLMNSQCADNQRIIIISASFQLRLLVKTVAQMRETSKFVMTSINLFEAHRAIEAIHW